MSDEGIPPRCTAREFGYSGAQCTNVSVPGSQFCLKHGGADAELAALRAAAKRVLEADMRGVRDLDALNALEDAAGFSQQGQRRFPKDNK